MSHTTDLSTKRMALKIPPLLDMKSSSISQIGYADGQLYVRFAKGKLYRYAGVSSEQFAALRTAESVGKHLQTHILAKHEGQLVPEADGA